MGTAGIDDAERERLERQVEAAPADVLAQLRPERREGELWHRYWHALVRGQKRRPNDVPSNEPLERSADDER
jgi:hypothetical protein